jgi:hypothetical protein
MAVVAQDEQNCITVNSAHEIADEAVMKDVEVLDDIPVRVLALWISRILWITIIPKNVLNKIQGAGVKEEEVP